MPTRPTFLDTNVFLYAVGRDHPSRAPCVAILGAVASGRLTAATSAEVVQEIVYVLSRRGRREDGLALARHVMTLVGLVLPVTGGDMALACSLLERHATIQPRDAVHAATMLNNGIRDVISADAHWDVFTGLHRTSPAEAARR